MEMLLHAFFKNNRLYCKEPLFLSETLGESVMNSPTTAWANFIFNMEKLVKDH